MTDIVQMSYPSGDPFYPKTHAQAIEGLSDEIGGAINYPVKSVNGKVGDVQIGAANIGTYTDDEIDNKLAGKVSKVTGKGLSTNDYTDADQTEVAKIANKVDKQPGKGLSTNDYTDSDKDEVEKIAGKMDAVLVSPSGNKFTLVVDDEGNLSTEAYVEGAGES
ncbi:hypothetical protein [Sporolactobacillus terrae]|uniref:hypothetical protein n=1 Tax=Sporolactobacillus terrae TaxID=269673 RepID=UPI00048E4E49|nr:hypothetical protein [Sporolactobacillus terrae]